MSYVDDVRNAKALKIDEITGAYRRSLVGEFTVDYGTDKSITVWADKDSVQTMFNLAVAGKNQSIESFNWIDASGVPVALTTDELEEVASKLFLIGEQNFEKKETLIAEVKEIADDDTEAMYKLSQIVW